MEKRIEYCVDTSFYDRNSKTYVSNEDNEYFVDLESAKEYFESLNIEKHESKTLWQFEIDQDGDFDNFIEIISKYGKE